MMKNKSKYSLKYRIIRLMILFIYIGCMAVLIFEAATPGKQSAAQSNEVGKNIGGLINDVGGDQAKEIYPTSCKITNSGGVKYIGDYIELVVETYPAEANRKSYTYSSSNEEVANVNENGRVKFIGSGEVTIRATNTFNKDIFDSIEFEVRDILCESLDSYIEGLNLIDNSYYELEYRNKSGYSVNYKIINKISPSNTTDKNITYEISNPEILSMVDDNIIPLDITDELVNIKIKCNEIEKTLYFKVVDNYEEPDLELISINASNITKYDDQLSKFRPSISYSPSYTIYKDYKMVSSDESIIEVTSDNYLKPTGNIGFSNITIISLRNEEITKTIKVTINKRPEISSINVNYNQNMYVGASQTLTVSKTPYNSIIKSTTYSTENTDLISITSNRIKALAVGEATINICVKDSYNNEFVKEITINIIEKPITTVDDFDINYIHGEVPIIYALEEINLRNYFKISKCYNEGNEVSASLTSYKFEFDSYSIDDDKILVDESGLITGRLIYINEDLTEIEKEIAVFLIYNFEIESDNLDNKIIVNDSINYSISNNLQEYDIKFSDEENISYQIKENNIKVIGIKSGDLNMIITPVYPDLDLSSYSKSIHIEIIDLLNDTFDLKMFDSSNNEIEDLVITINKNDTISYDYLINNDANLHNIRVKDYDSNIIRIRNNIITGLRVGETDLTILEEYSGIKYEYKIHVRNVIKLNEDKPVIVTGNYSFNDNTISVINGETLKIRFNFTSDSTFTKTTYSSSDTNFVEIGSDGVITPKKSGKAKISLRVYDGIEELSLTLNVNVQRKNLTDNINNFYYYIRKGIGHFGAFLVLGIFSTLFYLLFLRRKLYILGIAINFLFGFLFAGLTELIQKFVPGRSGLFSDVIIDYSGFLTSAIFITVLLTIIFVIKMVLKRKNEIGINNENIKLTEDDLALEDYKDYSPTVDEINNNSGEEIIDDSNNDLEPNENKEEAN